METSSFKVRKYVNLGAISILVILSFVPIISYMNFFINSFIIGIIFLFFLIQSVVGNFKFRLNNTRFYIVSFLLFWIGYSCLSYSWARDSTAVMITSISLLVHFFVFVSVLSYLIFFKHHFSFFLSLLILILFFYIFSSFYESFTMTHVWYSRKAEVMSFVPTGPFYNENTLAAAMIMLFPLVLFLGKYLNNKILSVIGGISSLSVILIALIQSARIALIFLFINITLYFLFFINVKQKISIIVVIVILFVSMSTIFPLQTKIAELEYHDTLNSIFSELEQIRPSSMKIRKGLFDHYGDFISKSWMFGIGSGNFVNEMSKWRKEVTFNVMDAHNYTFEILSTNGVIIGFFYIILIVYPTIKLLILFFREQTSKRYLYFAFFLSLFNYWGTNLLPGSLSKFSFHWIMFATAYFLIDQQDNDDCWQSDKINAQKKRITVKGDDLV